MKKGCGLCKRYGHGCQYHPDEVAMETPEPTRGHGAKCGGATRSGGTCRNRAGYKTDHVGFGHCHLHGGCTPGQRKGAQKQMAAKAVETYGLSREIAPHDALLEEIARTAGHVDWLGLRIAEMDPDSLAFGIAKMTTNTFGQTDVERRAAIAVWLDLYQRERRHLVQVCQVAIAAGIAERQVRLAEQQGRLIAEVIQGVLRDLGVADHPKAPAAVRRHLMLVAEKAS